MSVPTTDDLTNNHCRLLLHGHSLRGAVADYIIEFRQPETSLDDIVAKTFDLFHELCKNYSSTPFKARLIAECEFLRLNAESEVISRETYHFSSYSAEWVNVHTSMYFYEQHMQKIASRMDQFNRNGSSLQLNRIKHIHIAVTAIC